MSTTGSDQWRPDLKTLHWAAAVLIEDYLFDYVRSDVRSRAGSGYAFPELPDAFWLVATESAIETVIFELFDQANAAHALPADEPTDGEPLD